MTSLSVLMPVMNERGTVEEAIDRVLGADLPVDDTELIVVDDGSTDGTAELLRRRAWPDAVRLVRHERNRGKGVALRTAREYVQGDYVAVMDADLEYDPMDIGKLLQPLMAGEAEVVFGTRSFGSHTSYSFWYVVGNKLVTLVANVLYNSWLSDIMTCHKVMPAPLFRSLALTADGFDIEPEMTARVLKRGIRVFEVPISYRARGREEGKKLTGLDGVRVVARLVRCRLDGRA